MSPSRLELGRLWRTLKPLKRQQVLGRLAHEARQRAFRASPRLMSLALGTRPQGLPVAFTLPPPGLDPDATARIAQSLKTGRAKLAGHEVELRDWDSGEVPKLVRYHLHYLDTAREWAQGGHPAEAVTLISQWAQKHPLGGVEAWEPYPTAARLQNVCGVIGLLGPAAPEDLRALACLHARAVASWPEVHLQANHLLKNWCALAMAGLLFYGDEPARWEVRGLAGMRAELIEQVLSDGGHYERSPMYHLLVLSDLLDVRDFAKARGRAVDWLESRIREMASFSAATLHPDGELPLFNDAVLGQAPAPATVFARLGEVPAVPVTLSVPVASLQPPSVQLPVLGAAAAGEALEASSAPLLATLFDSPAFGLTVIRSSRNEALFFDSGPLGPDHQLGHAHSDTLSYELSVGGERRAVNAGVDGYQSKHRAFFRSAVAHNTLTVNGEGPDELWSSFRVGGRCEVLFRKVGEVNGVFFARAALRAFQGWTQDRTVALFPFKALVVLDRVEAAKEAVAVSRSRLVPGRVEVKFVPLLGAAAQRQSAYAPEFGKVYDVTEHSVTETGQSLVLGYALLWGAKSVKARMEGGRWSVELDGVTVELG